MTIKPFYIKTDGLSEEDIADAMTLCVNHGASAVEGVDGYHSLVDFEVVDSGETGFFLVSQMIVKQDSGTMALDLAIRQSK